MWQEHRHAAETTPFRLARTDELIDHNLRAIGEVAKLTFPDDERVWLGRCIAILKTEDVFLGKQ